METEAEPLLFVAIAHPSGDRQILVKRAGQDLTLALDASGSVAVPNADARPGRPLAAICWTGSAHEIVAMYPDGLHASDLAAVPGSRTNLSNRYTFRISNITASTHIERDTPAPISVGKARTIAIERETQLKEKLQKRETPPSMAASLAKVTLHFQSTGTVPSKYAPVDMRGGSMTLGRGNDNDVVLPDPDRMVSKHHCVIAEHGGDVVVLDLSTNGTFLNYGKIPLGRGRTKLNSGDILSIGPYEILVELPLVRTNPIADLPLPAEERIATGGVVSNADPGSIIDDPGTGQDFLDELTGKSSGIKGPSGVERPELGEDGLLPPLGDEDRKPDDRIPDPFASKGVSLPDHDPSVHDNHFPPPPAARPIPDDWEDDHLSPAPESVEESRDSPKPVPAAATPTNTVSLPDLDEFDDLLKREFGLNPDVVLSPAGDVLSPENAKNPKSDQHTPDVDIPASRQGRALFRVPRTMWTETAELAELRLAASDPLPVAMRAAMEATMTGRSTRTDVHPVERVGQRMKAQLLSDPRFFKIEPLSSEEQDFGDSDRLGWDWRVVPLREGNSLLTLRMTMTADLQGEAISIDTQALHKSVEITVKSVLTRPIRFVRDNWKWMLGSSGIGAVAAIYALVSR